MIAAGYVDGHLMELEQRRIWQPAVDQGMPSAALAQLTELLCHPSSMEDIVAPVNNLERKIEVDIASVFAIDENCAEGKGYLSSSAGKLDYRDHLWLYSITKRLEVGKRNRSGAIARRQHVVHT